MMNPTSLQTRTRSIATTSIAASLLGALLALLPIEVEATHDLEVTRHFRPRSRALAPFAEASLALLDDLSAEDPEHESRDELLKSLRESGLSWNGSLCLSLRRR